MNTKNNCEDNIEQTRIEDLNVNEERAAEVKGGPGGDIVVFDIIDSYR